jgi:hypothetical protein
MQQDCLFFGVSGSQQSFTGLELVRNIWLRLYYNQA